MDPFEQRLRKLPWRKPPAALRQRIFSSRPAVPARIIRFLFSRHVELGWAAALAACAGVIGFEVGRGHPAAVASPDVLSHTDLRIIDTGDDRNLFDLTPESEDPWPGPMRINVQQTLSSSG